jgi:hypothetical protein
LRLDAKNFSNRPTFFGKNTVEIICSFGEKSFCSILICRKVILKYFGHLFLFSTAWDKMKTTDDGAIAPDNDTIDHIYFNKNKLATIFFLQLTNFPGRNWKQVSPSLKTKWRVAGGG